MGGKLGSTNVEGAGTLEKAEDEAERPQGGKEEPGEGRLRVSRRKGEPQGQEQRLLHEAEDPIE